MNRAHLNTSGVVVRTFARLVGRLMLLFGVYVVLHGQVTFGGGFAGGVILTLGIILLWLAFGRELALRKLPRAWARMLASGAALGMLAIALTGQAFGHFFLNFLGRGKPFEYWSGGIVPLCDLVLSLVVTASLSGVFAALILFHSDAEDAP